MTLHRYSRVRGLKSDVTVDVREANPSFADRKHVVCVDASDAELLVSDWDKLVAEVNQLLGRGSVEAAGGS